MIDITIIDNYLFGGKETKMPISFSTLKRWYKNDFHEGEWNKLILNIIKNQPFY